jgi:hypothetical protein
MQVADIRGEVNDLGKALLRMAVVESSGWVPIPSELKGRGGKSFDTELTLDFNE